MIVTRKGPALFEALQIGETITNRETLDFCGRHRIMLSLKPTIGAVTLSRLDGGDNPRLHGKIGDWIVIDNGAQLLPPDEFAERYDTLEG